MERVSALRFEGDWRSLRRGLLGGAKTKFGGVSDFWGGLFVYEKVVFI